MQGKPTTPSLKTVAINAAKDFKYGKDVIKKLEAAETELEVSRIMRKARHEKFDKTNTDPRKVAIELEEKPIDRKHPVIYPEPDPSVKTYKCSEVKCRCKYSVTVSSGDTYCDYLCMTKQRRGCSPEKCFRFEPSNTVKGRELVRLKIQKRREV
jgi:hypothetical protein